MSSIRSCFSTHPFFRIRSFYSHKTNTNISLALDISADLTELSRSPVAVLAGGIKSILDIGRTLEFLETFGVPVLTYGNTKEFPNFFSPRSGFQSPYNVNSPLEAAKIMCNESWGVVIIIDLSI